MIKNALKLFFNLWLVFLLSFSAKASLREKEIKLQQLKKQIKTVKTKIIQKEQEEKRLKQALKNIEHHLLLLESQKKQIEKNITRLKKEIETIESQKLLIERDLSLCQKRLQKRLLAIYQWQRIGFLHLVTRPLPQYLVLSSYLEQIAKQDKVLLSKYTLLQQRLNKLVFRYKEKINELQFQKNHIEKLKVQITQEKKKKAKLLQQAKRLKAKYKRKMTQLKKDAARLERIIKGLKKQQLQKRVKITKGQMPWPAKGKIVVPFGRYKDKLTSTYLISNGIEIKVSPNSPFKAVASGKVVYADWLHSYGNVIILDHGGGYYTLYAHAISLYKKKGQWVKKGEVLGKVGEGYSHYGATLYFELRYHGKPIDPFVWLKPQEGG